MNERIIIQAYERKAIVMIAFLSRDETHRIDIHSVFKNTSSWQGREDDFPSTYYLFSYRIHSWNEILI